VAAFARGLPGDRGKGALEEGVVDDISFVIFAFNDPVAGIGFPLSGVGEDEGGVEALRGVDEKGPAGAKRVHENSLLTALFCRQELFQHFTHKKGVSGFVKFRKDFEPLFYLVLRFAVVHSEADSAAMRLNLSGLGQSLNPERESA
jgi:hypothetical protein